MSNHLSSSRNYKPLPSELYNSEEAEGANTYFTGSEERDSQKSKESYKIHSMAAANNSDPVTDPALQVIYRCKKCRRIVAAQENVVLHERGEGEKCFKWKKRSGDSGERDSEPPECSSIFVEPMKWMQAVEGGTVEDKLQCSGCKARLGSFNWAGMQCSCGAWVTPAFQLHKSRIDDCRT